MLIPNKIEINLKVYKKTRLKINRFRFVSVQVMHNQH